MGVSFSATTLKVKLKSALTRCKMYVNKKNNEIMVARRELATLISQNKEESALIKVEGVIAQTNLVRVLELLQLRCDLLTQRIKIIASSPSCPDDLLEPVSTIIYSSKRVEVPELSEIAQQLAAKWGGEWAKQHVNNLHKTVLQEVIDKLAIVVPSKKEIVGYLRGVCKEYEVEWEPNPELEKEPVPAVLEDEPESEEIKALSADMKIDYPGTLNVLVHQCNGLNTGTVGKVDAYCAFEVDGAPPKQISTVDYKNGVNPKWEKEHFPFSIKFGNSKLIVEVYNKLALGDKLIGSTQIDIDELIKSGPRKKWYQLTRGARTIAGNIELSAQYAPLTSDSKSVPFPAVMMSMQPQYVQPQLAQSQPPLQAIPPQAQPQIIQPIYVQGGAPLSPVYMQPVPAGMVPMAVSGGAYVLPSVPSGVPGVMVAGAAPGPTPMSVLSPLSSSSASQEFSSDSQPGEGESVRAEGEKQPSGEPEEEEGNDKDLDDLEKRFAALRGE